MPGARMRKSMLLRVTAYWLMAMPIPLGQYLWHTPLSVYYAFYAFALLGWLVPMACGRWWEKDKNLRWQGVLVFTLLWLAALPSCTARSDCFGIMSTCCGRLTGLGSVPCSPP